MDDLIIIKNGDAADRTVLPVLQTGELGCLTDRKELYVGINGENILLCRADDIKKIAEIEKLMKDVITRIEALEAVGE